MDTAGGRWFGRPLWAEIDLDAVAHNVQLLRARAAPARLVAIVKANAYGHGAVAVARAAIEAGASGLGVVCVDEADELRRAGIDSEFLLVGQAQTTEADWTISVNVSVRQLQNARFVSEVAEALADSGLEPQRLILEITESVMMQDVPSMMERLNELKSLGVRLAIDDFGTGYSSLSYLREFPFDLLKIDKAFIDDLGERTERKDLTRAIIELGKTLDLQLVAEGIESGEQVTRLTSLDCGLGQGFYFAEPLDAHAVTTLLTTPTEGDEAAA